MKFPSLTGLLAVVLAAPGSAQVVFDGVIDNATLPSFCQEETHYLTCSFPDPSIPTGVLLKSSTLDLDKYVGKHARFTANLVGVECDIYDVTAVQWPPPGTLTWCGAPVPGCPMRFRVGPSGVLGQFWLFAALAPAFQPVDATLGTILLQPPVFLIGQGLTSGAPVDLTLPTDPAITGLSIFLQGLRQDIGPIGPPSLTNAACFTILGPSPPCLPNDC